MVFPIISVFYKGVKKSLIISWAFLPYLYKDIENIRHGVVYAQTPLNMKEPFDSMIGFSAEKIYGEAIEYTIDAL